MKITDDPGGDRKSHRLLVRRIFRCQSRQQIRRVLVQHQRQSSGVTGAYVIITCLFFAWGFITSLVDPLVAAVKGIFHLSDVEAQLSASAFFIAYGVMSLPGAVILARARSVPTVLISLAMMVAGCLIMLLAANIAV